MNWLPSPQEFRDRLASVNYGDDANSRLETLARLANARLSFIETIQVDAALCKIPLKTHSFMPYILNVYGC